MSTKRTTSIEQPRQYHFITQLHLALSLPEHNHSISFRKERSDFRSAESQRLSKMQLFLDSPPAAPPDDSSWSISGLKCCNCDATMLIRTRCAFCTNPCCSKCRATVSYKKQPFTFCRLCNATFLLLKQKRSFQHAAALAAEHDLLALHLKVTKTLLLFDETFRTLRAFSDIGSFGDFSILKECMDRYREFTIITKHVLDLRPRLEAFASSSVPEQTIVRHMTIVFSKFNKDYILPAITFAEQFNTTVQDEHRRYLQLEAKKLLLRLNAIETPRIPPQGGVLRLSLSNASPQMTVLVNATPASFSFEKDTTLIQIPPKPSKSSALTIRIESSCGCLDINDVEYATPEATGLLSRVRSSLISNSVYIRDSIFTRRTTEQKMGASTPAADMSSFASPPTSEPRRVVTMQPPGAAAASSAPVGAFVRTTAPPQTDVGLVPQNSKLVFEDDDAPESTKSATASSSAEEETESDDEIIIFDKKRAQNALPSPPINPPDRGEGAAAAEDAPDSAPFSPPVELPGGAWGCAAAYPPEASIANEFVVENDDVDEIDFQHISTKPWAADLDFEEITVLDTKSKVEIQGISPSALSAAGGRVVVTGTCFGPHPLVFVRERKVDEARVRAVSDERLEVDVPPLSAGIASLRVENQFGQKDVVSDGLHVFQELPQ